MDKYYAIREQTATQEKEARIKQLTDTTEKHEVFNESRMRFVNEAVNDWVTNSNDPMRIVEWKGELIQKVSPIYFDDHRPANPLDFRANFYVPTKHFAGKKFDTFYFNIAFIWFISALFYIALYFQLFKKLVNSVEMYRKYRGKD